MEKRINYLLCDRQIVMKNFISDFRWHPGNHLSNFVFVLSDIEGDSVRVYERIGTYIRVIF